MPRAPMASDTRTGNRRPAPGPRPPTPAAQSAGARGVVYLMVLVALLVLGIASAAAAPVWRTEVRRDKEAELLFRLAEYRSAIARFRADHGRPPRELKDLLEDRSQLQTRHYLRRLYPDPITSKNDWKLDLVADRTGAILGIADLHSSSDQEPIRIIKGKRTYKDW